METSPGRSAIQATPVATTASETRKRMIRVIPASLLAECVRGLARKLTRGGQRSLPCLSFSDPILCWRARCSVELAEIGKRVVDGGVCSFDFDTRQHGGRVIARRRIYWTDTHELAGVSFQPLQEAARRCLRAGSLLHCRDQRAQVLRKRRDGGHATHR